MTIHQTHQSSESNLRPSSQNPAVYFCGDLLFALIWTCPLLHYHGWIVVVHTTTKYIVQISMYSECKKYFFVTITVTHRNGTTFHAMLCYARVR